MPHRRLTREVFHAILVSHVGQHCATQLTFFEASAEVREVGGKSFNVMVVIARVAPKLSTSQVTRSPRFIKRMAKQIVSGDSRVQLIEKLQSGHDCRFLPRLPIYEGREGVTTGAAIFPQRIPSERWRERLRIKRMMR